MLKKFKRIAFWLVFLTIYLNIGWGLGYYYHINVFTQQFEWASWHAKIMAGHCVLFGADVRSLENNEIWVSVLWPILLAISILSWIGHLIWWFLVCLWQAFLFFSLWILKFIFAGGLFKLVSGVS